MVNLVCDNASEAQEVMVAATFLNEINEPEGNSDITGGENKVNVLDQLNGDLFNNTIQH